jgi:hypothetical protein
MAAVPTLEQEDAKRPTREHEALVGERTRIVSRIKAALVRLGVRGFEPTRRGAPERLGALRTPEGVGLPPNTLAELLRDVTRLGLMREQIEQIEEARAERLREAPGEGTNAMVPRCCMGRPVGRVRVGWLGGRALEHRGRPPCRSRAMPTAGVTLPGSGTGSRTGPNTMRACAPAAA